MHSTTELEYPTTEFELEQDEENPLSMLVRNGPLVFKSNMPKYLFHKFLLKNSDLKIERDKQGVVTIHPLMTYESSINEGDAFFYLKLWAKKNKKSGKVLSPSGSFDLPDGSTHKADGAWVSMKKHLEMTEEERQGIAAVVLDFVMEVRSKTDSLSKLKRKMTEAWIANGVLLAWLIDPLRHKAWVYRQDGSTEEFLDFSGSLSGENVLPGFELKLSDLLEE